MLTLVISGGSSGIGLATANLFAAKGWRVYELSRSGKSHDGITHINCDVTSFPLTQKAIEEVIAQEGHIDLVVCNAGFGISGAVEFTSTEDARRQMDVNFIGTFNLAKAALPYLRKQSESDNTDAQYPPTIIMTSSVAAVLPIPYQAFYSASKAAINALALALRNEVKPFGIRVAALMPGDVKTGFTAARNKTQEGGEVYTNLTKSVATMEHDEQNGMSTEYIASLVWKIAHKRCPAPLYTTGFQYKSFVFLEKILPKRLSNWIVGMLY